MSQKESSLKKYQAAMTAMLQDKEGSYNEHNKNYIKTLRNKCLKLGCSLTELRKVYKLAQQNV